MTPRPCLECGKLIERGSRCPTHLARDERARKQRRANTEPWQAWYASPAFRAARAACLARAGNRCQYEDPTHGRCPVTSGLQAHHVTPARVAPELFNDPNNLLALCTRHHPVVEAAARKHAPPA